MYIDKLGSIVNSEYHNTHRTTKMKPIHVKSSTYIDFGVEDNDKDPKFEVVNHARISKYKNIIAKFVTFRIGVKKFLLLKKLKILFHSHVINDLNSRGVAKTQFLFLEWDL